MFIITNNGVKMATIKKPLSKSARYYKENPKAHAKKLKYSREYHKKKGSGETMRFYREHPEAYKKKLEYSREYNKSAEQRAYRSALNKANRAAGTYGNGDGLDVSHTTSKKKFVLEPQSVNRARNGSGGKSTKLSTKKTKGMRVVKPVSKTKPAKSAKPTRRKS